MSKAGPGSLVPTGAAYYVYDEAGRLLGEYDTDQVPIYETVYLGDTPVALIKQVRSGSGGSLVVQTGLSFVYADHLDTPRVVARSSDQAIVWRWDQAEPFGASVPNENPNGLGAFKFNLRFPGQVFDAETGLFYNWHRDYSAGTGRYVQSDPIGLAGAEPVPVRQRSANDVRGSGGKFAIPLIYVVPPVIIGAWWWATQPRPPSVTIPPTPIPVPEPPAPIERRGSSPPDMPDDFQSDNCPPGDYCGRVRALCRQTESPTDLEGYRRAVGSVMGELWDAVLAPLYDEHPDLKPAELEDD